LHIGSLYTAVASFLQAKSQQGKWLLRIDDLDRSRCKPEYASAILRTLEQYALEWDEDVLYQNTREDAYQHALNQLKQLKLLYPCGCSRKNLTERQVQNGIYDGYCLQHSVNENQASSLRLKVPNKTLTFHDLVQGQTSQHLKKEVGDFVILRKDRIHAYHLAVILDDQEQGITQVLRGYDLLDSTYRQIHLQELLGIAIPSYAHIPVISDMTGAKLSKQTFADDISLSPTRETLFHVLKYLNLNPPAQLLNTHPKKMLAWGVDNWSLDKIQPQTSIQFGH